jgi:hypothetical protein
MYNEDPAEKEPGLLQHQKMSSQEDITDPSSVLFLLVEKGL